MEIIGVVSVSRAKIIYLRRLIARGVCRGGDIWMTYNYEKNCLIICENSYGKVVSGHSEG